MQTVAVIDFETTGLSPAMGDRATDAAVVMVADGKIANNRGQTGFAERPKNHLNPALPFLQTGNSGSSWAIHDRWACQVDSRTGGGGILSGANSSARAATAEYAWVR